MSCDPICLTNQNGKNRNPYLSSGEKNLSMSSREWCEQDGVYSIPCVGNSKLGLTVVEPGRQFSFVVIMKSGEALTYCTKNEKTIGNERVNYTFTLQMSLPMSTGRTKQHRSDSILACAALQLMTLSRHDITEL